MGGVYANVLATFSTCSSISHAQKSELFMEVRTGPGMKRQSTISFFTKRTRLCSMLYNLVLSVIQLIIDIMAAAMILGRDLHVPILPGPEEAIN